MENVSEKAERIAEFATSDAETFNLAVPNVTKEKILYAMKLLLEEQENRDLVFI